ncbi:MAG: cadmium-translocating P-type ATPase [Pseudomonadota bacterium]|jgi:Cu+-exporting ATPase
MTDGHFDPRRPSQEVTLHVSGFHCTNCALSVEKHLARVGVEKPSVDFASGRTSFSLQDPTKLPDIIESIQKLGYSVEENPNEHGHHGRDTVLYVKTFISAALTLPMLVGMFLSIHSLHDPILQAILATPVFIIGVLHFGSSGLRSLKAGVANMDVLITAGILAAYIASMVTILFGLSHELLFFEAVGSIVTFVLIGHLLEELAVKKTTSAIEELSQLQPQEVRRIRSQGSGLELLETIALRELNVGDLVQINTGDRTPTDGVIVRGSGSFDESMLTGESLPVDHTAGDKVIGGTVLVGGSVVVKTSAVGDDTTLAGIIRLVRDAQRRKPSIQRIGDAVSAVFVPTVLAIAVLTFIVSTLVFNVTLAQAIVRSLAIVVVACPCAMGLATPSAIMVAIGRAARSGILIRGGDTLERLGQISHVAFDKTGTLTRGTLSVKKFRTHNDEDQRSARSLLVSLQRASSHPIAQAIVRDLQSPELNSIHLSEIVETKGVGLSARGDDGALYQCGGRNLATQLNLQLFDDIILVRNGVVIASLHLQDELRPEAAPVVKQLDALACGTSLISGDTTEKCREVATTVGIHNVYAQQLPEQKLALLRALQQKQAVAYVGDGINDAPTLAEAAVGISLSSASDIAMQSAQVLLTGGTIGSLPSAIRLSRLTVQTIKQNLFWALVYNVATVPLAASGYISPLAGALLMTFSDLVIVGNSLRIKYRSIS